MKDELGDFTASRRLIPISMVAMGIGVLAAFVAINTIMYAAVTVVKLLPSVNPSSLRRSYYERSETRSIYPDGPR